MHRLDLYRRRGGELSRDAHPNDPQKYLRKNFEGKYSVSGVPFLDYRCTPDTNLIIYGHNMKNGTMFSDLKKYLDKTFREQHPVIELETADGVRYFTANRGNKDRHLR